MTQSSLKTLSPRQPDATGAAVDFTHVPVLADEVVACFKDVPSGTVVDCTAGGGGHSALILASRDDLNVVALDRDPTAVAAASARLAPFGDRAKVVHAAFSQFDEILSELKLGRLSGVLADLGVSSHHLDTAERGFSFRAEGPLDMRMDPSSGLPLQDRLAGIGERELADVLYHYGDIRASRRAAAAVLGAWRDGVESTSELAERLRSKLPRGGKIHPATLVFQALRMWVNDEPGQLLALLEQAPARLNEHGVLAVISFHSGEDRNVKQAFRALAQGRDADFERLSKKPLIAGKDELFANPRARSAKLRGIRRKAPDEGSWRRRRANERGDKDSV